jgi:Fur family zinc uptake transcriptional regulator
METSHAAPTEAILDEAARRCAAAGAQLTPLRRLVLRLVLEAGQPVGAYALLERLKGERGGVSAAPPTVYRALDFLLEQGLVHKLERLNAFLPCVAAHEMGEEGGHAHPHQFLICRGCGRTAEVGDHAVARALEAAAARLGFRLERATVEAEGLCAACQSAA